MASENNTRGGVEVIACLETACFPNQRVNGLGFRGYRSRLQLLLRVGFSEGQGELVRKLKGINGFLMWLVRVKRSY